MSKIISCSELSTLMSSDRLFAVFDVRERGEYNDSQIPNTTSLPRSQIEMRIAELVPNRTIPLVVYDEGGKRAELAADTLTELGYANIAILGGGLAAWQNENRETVSGVNVPSKAFGEKVHHDRGVPDLSPEELKTLIDRSESLTILDVRTAEEYGRFCIPGGINVPNGDLILWAAELRQKPTVIVNCAGRTRSIIGTATLRRLGLTNVRALRNGTMGWLLAGFNLETKPGRRAPAAHSESRAQALAVARSIAEEENIDFIEIDDIQRLIEEGEDGRTYLIDVRSEAEFAAGHVAGSINVPGGQAVQRADDFVPVRNAQIVFISNQSARAVMAAYWYRQMGFKQVRVLQGGLDAWKASGQPLVTGASVSEPLGFGAAKRATLYIDAANLRDQIETGSCMVLDVSTSLEHERAHVPDATWISRGWIDIKLPELIADRGQRIILTCPDARQSTFAAQQLARVGYVNIWVLAGGLAAWTAAGCRTESGVSHTLTPANDVVLSPSIRGNKEDMQKYLDWELKLKH
ncbi:MAG: rhodanese-like domain-containing protein [Candidatus Binatia bacterium]